MTAEPGPQELRRARRNTRVAIVVALVLLSMLAFSVCSRIEDPARTIACTEAGDGASLAGTVRTLDGDPLGGVEVTLEGTPAAATTDALGAFALPDLVAGTYTLRVDGEGYPELEREIEVPDCAATIAIALARDEGGTLVPLIGPYL